MWVDSFLSPLLETIAVMMAMITRSITPFHTVIELSKTSREEPGSLLNPFLPLPEASPGQGVAQGGQGQPPTCRAGCESQMALSRQTAKQCTCSMVKCLQCSSMAISEHLLIADAVPSQPPGNATHCSALLLAVIPHPGRPKERFARNTDTATLTETWVRICCWNKPILSTRTKAQRCMVCLQPIIGAPRCHCCDCRIKSLCTHCWYRSPPPIPPQPEPIRSFPGCLLREMLRKIKLCCKVIAPGRQSWRWEPPPCTASLKCASSCLNTSVIKTTKRKIGTSCANTVEVGAARRWEVEWGWIDFPCLLMR